MKTEHFRRAEDLRPYAPLRHGAYLCLSFPGATWEAARNAPVGELANRLGLHGEYEPAEGEPPASVAYLRRIEATPGRREDGGLLGADAVVHVGAQAEETVAAFREGLLALLGPAVGVFVLAGVVRPTVFTGNALHNFAYAHRVLPQPGRAMPHAFLAPMSKTAEWWRKGWMERHTYFLPRYDEAGNQVREGHALAASAGVDALMRRTYKHPEEPAPSGAYDFLNYFECAEEGVPVFHAVRAALRDVTRNPEWAYVLEGPTWHGRRVPAWADLFSA